MSSLLATFLFSSILVSMAIIIFVTGMNNIKLTRWDFIHYTLLLAILHSVAMCCTSRLIAPFLCILTYSMMLGWLLDIKLGKSFKSVMIWYVIALVFEVFTSIIAITIIKVDSAFLVNSFAYLASAFTCNSMLLVITILFIRWRDKMGAWLWGKLGTKKSNPNKPVKQK